MKELFQFLLSKKKYWLIPVIKVLLIIGKKKGNILESSALSPFIYTLF